MQEAISASCWCRGIHALYPRPEPSISVCSVFFIGIETSPQPHSIPSHQPVVYSVHRWPQKGEDIDRELIINQPQDWVGRPFAQG